MMIEGYVTRCKYCCSTRDGLLWEQLMTVHWLWIGLPLLAMIPGCHQDCSGEKYG